MKRTRTLSFSLLTLFWSLCLAAGSLLQTAPLPTAPVSAVSAAAPAYHTENSLSTRSTSKTTPPVLMQTDTITPTMLEEHLRGMVIRDPWYDFGTSPGQPDQPNYAAQDRMGQDLADLGVRWVRMEFIIEGGNPITTTHTARYDYFINEVAPRHNLKILGLLSFGLLRGVPPCDLASGDTWNDALYGGGVNYYMQTWLYRARMIVSRYEGRIAAYQVLNEHNRMTPNCDYIPPTMAARLHTKFYRFFRQVDRNTPGGPDQSWRDDIPIVLGAIHPAGTRDLDDDDYVSDREYVRQTFESEAFRSYDTTYGQFPVDGIGYHPYPEEIRNSPQSDVDFITVRLNSVRATLQDIYEEQDKDSETIPSFWISEIGHNAAFISQTGESQAEFLHDSLLGLAARNDVEAIFWFKYEDFPPASGPNAQKWGVVRIPFVEGACPGGFCYDVDGHPSLRRPSYWVYRELTGRGDATPEPPASIIINAPAIARPGAPVTVTATISRTTATLPITYTWQATDHNTVKRTSSLSDTLIFTWPITSTNVISLEATNAAGTVIESRTVRVENYPLSNQSFEVFLPLVQR